MPVLAHLVSRVVIANEWFSVELGSFKVEPMSFEDRDGNAMQLDIPAYSFRNSETKDEYYGPLTAITLYKFVDM